MTFALDSTIISRSRTRGSESSLMGALFSDFGHEFKIQLGQVSIVLTVHYFPIMDTFPDNIIEDPNFKHL